MSLWRTLIVWTLCALVVVLVVVGARWLATIPDSARTKQAPVADADKRATVVAESVPREPERPAPPCRTGPLTLAPKARTGTILIARSSSPSRSEEAAWLNAEAERAGVVGFCVGDAGLCPPGWPACFLRDGRAIATRPDAPTRLILRELARALDENHSPDCPHRRGPSYRKALTDLAEKFDRRFAGRRMANAVLYDIGLPGVDDDKCHRNPPVPPEARTTNKQTTAQANRKANAYALPAPPCDAKPILRVPRKTQRAANRDPRMRSRVLTYPEAMWLTAQARRAGVSGFCLMRSVREFCPSWATACFLGRSRAIVLQPDASIVLLLHEMAHALDDDHSPDCPHRHGGSFQRAFVNLAKKFDRRFPRREMTQAVVREINSSDYYSCHWKPKS